MVWAYIFIVVEYRLDTVVKYKERALFKWKSTSATTNKSARGKLKKNCIVDYSYRVWCYMFARAPPAAAIQFDLKFPRVFRTRT